MYFIWEPKESIPNWRELKKWKAIPLKEACNIYQFLYKIPLEYLKDIQELYFINNNDNFEINNYLPIFRDFTADLFRFEKEEFIKDIIDETPPPELRNNRERISLCENIINSTKEIVFKTLDDLPDYISDRLLIFIPNLSVKNKNQIISVKSRDLHLFTNYGLSKNEEIIELDIVNYIEIEGKLNSIKEETNLNNYDYVNLRNFRPPTFLENFGNSFYDDVLSIASENEKKVYLEGDNLYLAKRGIDHFTSSEITMLFDLRRGINQIDFSSRSIALLNIDSIKRNEEFKSIYKKIYERDENYYTVLEGLKVSFMDYFNNFRMVQLPDDQKIREIVTSIFISLLIEKHVYKERHEKLYPIVQKNLLNNLFTEEIDLSTLDATITKMGNISYYDITQSAEFWNIFLQTYSELLNGKSKPPPKIKNEITFVHQENDWIITTSDHYFHVSYLRNNPVKYLVVIIRYNQIYKKPIDIDVLREKVIEYDKKPNWNRKIADFRKEKYINFEQIYKTCNKQLCELKKPHYKERIFAEIYTKYVRYSKASYSLNLPPEITIEIQDENLPQDLK
ncbi:MAG: hypothetical protein K9H48_17585 [Melioribacteraceae bacterium]|nr:hypothetical protein [Melioribacteraceae bacterium]